MNSRAEQSPPKWASKLLRWYCRPELAEDLEGDLHECFQRNVQSKGLRHARLIYIIDVLKFIRPYTVRTPSIAKLLLQYIMIGSYIKTSGRNIARNTLFSSINILGLAVSMSVGLLLIGLLTDMHSYDRFHKNGERIYRVVSRHQYLNQADDNRYASSSPLAGKEIRENIPGVEAAAILYSNFGGDAKTGDRILPISGLYANEDFFEVFSFQLLEGNAATALKEPFSLVLTETAAKKLFGDEPAMSKVVALSEDQQYTVTGVVKDPPMFSHIQFESLASLSTREITRKANWEQEMSWSNMWSGYTYLLLPEDTDLAVLQKNLDVLCEEKDKTIKNTKISLSLQPLFDIALGENMNNTLGKVMGVAEVRFIGILAMIVLLSACFNYTNLSIARATRRSREVGIRKAIGALRGDVMAQFILESLMVSFLALGLAFVLFILVKPYFLSLLPQMLNMLTLDLSLKLILYFIALAAAVGLIAGIVPAVVFSKMSAIQVLKDSTSVKLFRHLNLRKGLIVLQYTISLVFITVTVIGLKQYKFLINFDLGYNTENILNIDLQGNNPDLLVHELNELPEVEGVSRSLMITSLGNHWGTKSKYIDPMDSSTVYYNGVDEHYIPLHEIRLMAGTNFTALGDSAIESEVIVNEMTLKRFNIGDGDPQKAINEILYVDNKPMKIIGVVKDYHYSKADSYDYEVALRYMKSEANYLNVKVATTDWLGTLAKIDAAWKKIDNVHPLDAELYADEIAYSYREVMAMLKMVGVLAFLAICIASLGLLGMVIFLTETRIKEMSIRKVLGASEGRLMYLLSRGFIFLLALSGAIALPLTYLFFKQIAFRQFPNNAPIGVADMFLGFIVILIIATVMIGSQTLKIARANPAEVLKSE